MDPMKIHSSKNFAAGVVAAAGLIILILANVAGLLHSSYASEETTAWVTPFFRSLEDRCW